MSSEVGTGSRFYGWQLARLNVQDTGIAIPRNVAEYCLGTLAFKIALVISFDTKRRGFRNWSFDVTAD